MRRLLALGVAAAALAPLVPLVPLTPASALPCDDLVVRRCLDPVLDKIVYLCFPPQPSDPYGC